MVKHADLACLPAAGSRLPAPGCRRTGVQSKRLAGRPGVGGEPRRRGRFSEINTVAGPAAGLHRGPVKTLSHRPARRCREACTSGKVFRNHNRVWNFTYIQNSCPEPPARRCRQALTAGRLSEINTGARNSPPFKTVLRGLGTMGPGTMGPRDHGTRDHGSRDHGTTDQGDDFQ